MARDAAKNLDHLLIRKDPESLIPGFSLGGVEYMVPKKVPSTAIVKLTTAASNVEGMIEYILECLPNEDQNRSFQELTDRLDADGLGEIVGEIVEKTTPFDLKKPAVS